jgi:hypothetical protein
MAQKPLLWVRMRCAKGQGVAGWCRQARVSRGMPNIELSHDAHHTSPHPPRYTPVLTWYQQAKSQKRKEHKKHM